MTGLSLQQIELTTKQIELLKTALSKLTRVAILWDSFATDQLKAADAASRSLGIRTQPLELRGPSYDFGGAFDASGSLVCGWDRDGVGLPARQRRAAAPDHPLARRADGVRKLARG